MDRLCGEILQLILNELDFPAPFTAISKRYYEFSRDPYVRAQYFLAHYGRTQALYWALGSGRLMNERVIDILLTSGAHLSRYLVQIAIHHFYRSSVPYIKAQWVRTMPLSTFAYFQKVAAERLGAELPPTKGDDDGTIFTQFLKERQSPPNLRSIKLETILEIFEKYKFIPFCAKDPIMTQFPLALAIEPRLLPLAVANGFTMDSRYRDFIFRRMFERSNSTNNSRSDDMLQNVRELCRLDASMFVSRTVAAEVCMEAQTNVTAFSVLRTLDSKGELRFDLSSVVEELIKLFVKTRSITLHHTVNALRHLYAAYPSKDPTVRLVMLVTVFNGHTPATVHAKLESLKLLPLTKRDVHNVLLNPFIERHTNVMEYAKTHLDFEPKEMRAFLEDIATKCLEITCKGRMLKSLHAEIPSLEKTLVAFVQDRYQIAQSDLDGYRDDLFGNFEARLCRDLNCVRSFEDAVLPSSGSNIMNDDSDDDEDMDQLADDYVDFDIPPLVPATKPNLDGLGHIGQETLSQAIRQDELVPARRRRSYPTLMSHFSSDYTTRLHYPEHSVHVARWIRSEFGPRHFLTAVFMTHAIINHSTTVIPYYLPSDSPPTVPITLKHFQLLARLGRMPHPALFQSIQHGAPFYMTEDDYLHEDASKIKKESTPSTELVTPVASFSSVAAPLASTSAIASSSRVRSTTTNAQGRRPRRSAAASVKSYVVPDSDDEAIADDKMYIDTSFRKLVKEVKEQPAETHLQQWIKHLAALVKEEQKKYNEKRKQAEKASEPGTKIRVMKSNFLKEVSVMVRELRKADEAQRLEQLGSGLVDDDYSEDDDEYHHWTTRAKRQKMTNDPTIHA